MQANDLYTIGLDVDDKSFHGFCFAASTGEALEFRVEPDVQALFKQLKKISKGRENFRICYEATYLGFSLCRELRKAGYHCDVIAPSLIPTLPGNKVKTDRLDAEKLARYYAMKMLTVVNIPDQEQEAERSLIRSRKFLKDQGVALQHHIGSITRCLGWNYKNEKGGKSKWTATYFKWLQEKINACEFSEVKINLEILIRQYESLNGIIQELDRRVEELSEKPKNKPFAKALGCFRGIDRLTAMVLITELGDIRRFKHPRQVTSYAGLDIMEKSSGGNEKKSRISKDGNRFIRTAVVEACQSTDRAVLVSRRVKERREGADPKHIEIADRCMKRLNKKSRKLLARGKPRNKVKVACARELLGFIWEAMQEVAKAA